MLAGTEASCLDTILWQCAALYRATRTASQRIQRPYTYQYRTGRSRTVQRSKAGRSGSALLNALDEQLAQVCFLMHRVPQHVLLMAVLIGCHAISNSIVPDGSEDT